MKMLTTFVLVCAGMALTNAAAVPEAEPVHMEQVEVHVQRDNGVVLSGSCPLGWDSYNYRCYMYIAESQPWAYAEKDCRERGGNLVSIHSFDEESFVQGVIHRATNEPTVVWIGGSDAQHEGFWLWSDSSNFLFTNWCPGQPDNGEEQEHCHVLNLGGTDCWHDIDCVHKRPYVCVKRV